MYSWLIRAAPVLLLALLPAGPLWAGSTLADAEKEEQAKRHFYKGVEFFDEGDFDAALAEFLESNKISPYWAINYNIGICYKMTKRYAKGLATLKQYIEQGKGKISDKRKAKVRKMIGELEEKVGSIRLCCNLGSVDVIIDGTELHVAGPEDDILLDPGLHKIAVHWEGREAFSTEVVVVSGNAKTIHVEFDGAGEKPSKKKGKSMGLLKKKEDRESLWLWIGLGVGGVLAVGTILSGIEVILKNNEMESEIDICTNTLERENCPKAYALRDEAELWRYATNILLVCTLVMAGTGLALYFYGPKIKKKKKKRKLSFSVNPGPAMGLNMTMRF